MSSSASSSKPTEKPTTPKESTKEETAPQNLGVLEEDDEFEEFAVAGSFQFFSSILLLK